MFGSRPRQCVAPPVLLILFALVFAGASASPATAKMTLDPGEAADSGGGAPGTTVFVRSASTAATSSKSTSLIVARPLVVGGDVMVAGISTRLSPSETITPPLGWTLIRRDANIGGSALSQALYVRVAGSPELPTSYTWRFSSSTGAAGGIIACTRHRPLRRLHVKCVDDPGASRDDDPGRSAGHRLLRWQRSDDDRATHRYG
jgi:hypothetical protein